MFHFKKNYKYWQFWLRLVVMSLPIAMQFVGEFFGVVFSYLNNKLPKIPNDIKGGKTYIEN